VRGWPDPESLQERLLTVREVANYSRLSPKAVRRAIAQGELRAIRLRGQYRIRPDDLQRWIETNRYRPRQDDDEFGPPAPVTPPQIGSPASLRALERGSPA
jgi:excisionase family DNA binding protein